RGDVHTEVHDFEAVAFHHHLDDVLADVVEIANYGADYRLRLAFVARADQLRSETLHRFAHRARGDHHLRQEELAGRVLLAHDVHRRNQRLRHEALGIDAFAQRSLDRRERVRPLPRYHAILDRFEPVFAHR